MKLYIYSLLNFIFLVCALAITWVKCLCHSVWYENTFQLYIRILNTCTCKSDDHELPTNQVKEIPEYVIIACSL